MENIEFKAELRDPVAARAQCRALGATLLFDREQVDTYYRLPDGRLKRRESPGVPIEWIFYHRPDSVQARRSTFAILSDEQARTRWGARSLPEWVCVRKRREAWIADGVRVHIDDVEGLGRFLEIEAPVTGERTSADCTRRVQVLRETFAPILGEPIAVSYCDLVSESRTT